MADLKKKTLIKIASVAKKSSVIGSQFPCVYSSTTYRFEGNGTLYRGINSQSGAYWSGSAVY